MFKRGEGIVRADPMVRLALNRDLNWASKGRWMEGSVSAVDVWMRKVCP